jgi:hypothetical protein
VGKRTWDIKGWDGPTEIFNCKIPGSMTDNEVGAILQRLVARHLEPHEVVAASLRKNFRGYAPLLACHFDRGAEKGNMVMVGSNPCFVALRKRQK